MSQSSEKILNYLTGNENIEAVDVEVLQKLVAENPYFPITQFLLAKKLKSIDEEQYSNQAQKTALYFSNPLWLNYQLTEERFEEKIIDDEPAIIPTKDPENDVSEAQNSANNESVDISQSSFVDNGNHSFIVADETEIAAKALLERDIEEPENLEVNGVVNDVKVVEVQVDAVTSNLNEEQQSWANDDEANGQTKGIADDDFMHVPHAADMEVTELKEEEMAGVTHTIDETTDKFVEETEHGYQKEELPPDDEHDRMFQNIKAMLDASSEEASADTKDAVIPMDPYYTIDYFASQGIKLEFDQNPQDQLGQHLKKFTQWLKHMKKLGPEDATEAINRAETEEDIQQIADSSNTVREVVTEAMASVLEKQGKKDKAIELYNKLSFLNPGKRAYFADKIKKLKGI